MKWKDICEIEFFEDVPAARRMTCKLCGQVVFEVEGRLSESEIAVQVLGIRAHYSIAHGIDVPVTKV